MVHELLANLYRRLGNKDAALAEMQLADQATVLGLEPMTTLEFVFVDPA